MCPFILVLFPIVILGNEFDDNYYLTEDELYGTGDHVNEVRLMKSLLQYK